MNLVELILLSLILKSHPDSHVGEVSAASIEPEEWFAWAGTQGKYFTTHGGDWNPRFSYTNRFPITGRGGLCYGVTGYMDPPWLGNSEYLYPSDDTIMSTKYEITNSIGIAFWHRIATSTHPLLTVTPIMYKGKPLYGWFHLKLIPTDTNYDVKLQQVYAHVETENDFFAPAGSFVRTRFTKGGCATVNADEKYVYKPCTYAQDPFIHAHNTFLRRTTYNEAPASYEWNVKIDFPLCRIYRSDNALYFRVLITDSNINDRSVHMPDQKWIYLKDYNYGAPDPEPPSDAQVDCTKEDAQVNWIERRSDTQKNVSWWTVDCTMEQFYHVDVGEPQYSWGGRCCIGFSEPYSQKSPYLVPRPTHKYHCRRQSTDYKHAFYHDTIKYTAPKEDWPYPEIEDYEKEALKAATIKCESKQCKETVVNQTNEGVSAKSVIGRYIFAGRQGHGILMVIACLFVYPLTNFVSRYFKGTFMTTRYIANIHAWYAVHIYGTLTTLTLLLTGVGLGIYAREYLGHSFHIAGRAHVALGYITCLLFLGGICSNALRCGKKASGNCSIILHACFGVFFYYLALATVALSVWIPGSPGGHKQKRATLLDNIANSVLVVVTLLFPMFEIVVHVFGTIQMCKRDVRFGVLRDWACFVAIPRVAAGEHRDEAGTGLRSILFVVYLLGASVATIIALVTIGTSDPDGHFFDKMTYTHVNGKLSTENVAKYEEAEDVLL